MDANPKQQVAEKLRASANVLVTVAKNPSVDQLAAAIGLSLMLDALGKHTATVFSGQIPDILKFLEPEKTFDSNVDSLRDFIISLDKDKADKLRYKVEDDVVKVYITPYRSKITEADLTFTQGDFNVDAVVALGVKKKADLDEAIVAHGRILHDATIIAVNAGEIGGDVGAIDWTDPNANSYCEMLVSISEALEGGILDAPMSTAFLTGIVSVTERFSNDKTTPKLMTMAAQLMAAGANQQLISKELQIGLNGGTSQSSESSTLNVRAKKKSAKKQERVEEVKEKIDELKQNASDIKLDELEFQLKNASDELEDDLADDDLDDDQGVTVDLDNEEPEFIEEKIDLPEVVPEPQPEPQPQPVIPPEIPPEPPVVTSKTENPTTDEPLNPHLGGTFNATSEEAQKAKANERKMGFNDEILSHSVTPLGEQSQAPGDQFAPPVPQQDTSDGLEEARRAVEQAASQSPFNPANNPLDGLNSQPMTSDLPQQVYHDPMAPMPPQPPATPPPLPPNMNFPPAMDAAPPPPPPQTFNPNMDIGNQTFSIPGQAPAMQPQPQMPPIPESPWPPQQQMPPQAPGSTWPPQAPLPPAPNDTDGFPPPPQ